MKPKLQAFNHLDLSLTTGTTGLGIDVATPIGDYLQLRTGFSFMPHFSHTMHFGVQVGDDPATSQSKFERLSGLLTNFTGNKVDNQVDMLAVPTYWNWNLMVDIKPFRNKHWHFTAGFYLGNRQIGKAYNITEDMPSLMAVGIYNNLYEKAIYFQPYLNVGDQNLMVPDIAIGRFYRWGRMAIHLGEYTHDVYYEEDEHFPADGRWAEVDGQWVAVEAYREIVDWDNPEEVARFDALPWTDKTTNDVMHHAGDVKHHKGDAYRMVPDEDSMAKAWAYVNRFKPYLGFGYGGRLMKNDDRWNISFDCGILFWGGKPDIVTHDGTDLVNDVENIGGKVGDYVDFISKFKAFPVLNLRITRRLF